MFCFVFFTLLSSSEKAMDLFLVHFFKDKCLDYILPYSLSLIQEYCRHYIDRRGFGLCWFERRMWYIYGLCLHGSLCRNTSATLLGLSDSCKIISPQSDLISSRKFALTPILLSQTLYFHSTPCITPWYVEIISVSPIRL